VKHVLSSCCAIAAFMLALGAFSYTSGQTAPDPFVTQITSSPAGGLNNPFLSAGTISGDGRFVAIESNGDIATEKSAARNNADGNREIFLLDYAQRRIFQITNTTSALKPPPSPTPTPTPSASPTPTPAPTPEDPSLVAVEVSNNRPVISNDGRWIAFSSNASTPDNFDGNTNATALAADGNQELFLYFIPAAPVVNLSDGGEQPFVDLTAAGGGTFTRITDTPASRPPTAGTSTLVPFVADDNRDASVNDNASVVAFVSTRNLTGGNADGNPEVFIYRRTPTVTMTQVTSTADVVSGGRVVGSIFNENPTLSGSGSAVAFISNANITTPVGSENNDGGRGFGNAEVYLASFDAVAATSAMVRQVTRTRSDSSAATVNILSPGHRVSRNGSLIAFESLAEDPKANSTTNKSFLAVFVYTVAGDTFTQIGPRPTQFPGDIIHFPTFTDYDSSLAPATLVFTSALNFKSDGTFPPADQGSTGLNSTNQPQIFSATLATPITFTKLTSNPVGGFGGIRPAASNTRERIAFSLGGSELGGGNTDQSQEVFYLLSRQGTDAAAGTGLSFFAGASNFPVAAATPLPSPTPAPTPAPTPGTIALGLAPGELSITRSTAALAPIDRSSVGGSETARNPILPVELNGVSVAVNGAAAGLYFVGDSPAEGISFVMPIGLSNGVANVVVNNNGTTYRGFVQIVAAQPDLFSSTGDAGGTAVVCNVTNPTVSDCVTGTFPLNSSNGTALVPTVIEIHLTGVRSAATTETTVAIGATNIVPSSVRRNTNMFGFDLITATLPAALPTGTHKVIITVTRGAVVTTSRAAATAPEITIVP
jgi:uncharacterized protein (TIGR03437 family)